MRQVIGKGMLATAAASSILSLSGSNAVAAGGDAVAANSPGILSGNSVQAPLDVPVNACGNTADAAAALNPATGNSCANSGAAAPKQEHTSAPERAATQEPAATQNRAATQERAATRTDDGRGYGDTSDTGSYSGTHAGTQALAESDASHSPGVLSGNNLQAPMDVPVNACGNTVDLVALLNPAFGNGCANGAPAPTPPRHQTPPSYETPPEAAQPPVERAVPRPAQPAEPPQHVASSSALQVSSAAPQAARLAETGSDQDLMAAAAASAALLIGGGILYRRGRASSGR